MNKDIAKKKFKEKIGKFRQQRKNRKIRNLTVVKRSNKAYQALYLPKVPNLNPCSIYNKISEFSTFVDEEEIDLICMSESWERQNLQLNDVIKLPDYKIASNVFQRIGKGGRPAIIANTNKRTWFTIAAQSCKFHLMSAF